MLIRVYDSDMDASSLMQTSRILFGSWEILMQLSIGVIVFRTLWMFIVK